MKAFLSGFGYAFQGIIYCIKNERNMRIHTVAAIFVLIFARFFAFDRGEYGVLLLTIGGVLSAEGFNTAIEKLADRLSKEKHPLIKAAKDAAAGAVLIAAIFSILIAVVMFSKPEGWESLFQFYTSHPLNAGGIIVLGVVSLVYIIIGPKGIKKLFGRKEK